MAALSLRPFQHSPPPPILPHPSRPYWPINQAPIRNCALQPTIESWPINTCRRNIIQDSKPTNGGWWRIAILYRHYTASGGVRGRARVPGVEGAPASAGSRARCSFSAESFKIIRFSRQIAASSAERCLADCDFSGGWCLWAHMRLAHVAPRQPVCPQHMCRPYSQ